MTWSVFAISSMPPVRPCSLHGTATREELGADEMLSLSLVRLLEIIGEAANGVSTDFREKRPQIPWKKMIGLRNRLIHGYFDINLDIVWDTVVEDLPPL